MQVSRTFFSYFLFFFLSVKTLADKELTTHYSTNSTIAARMKNKIKFCVTNDTAKIFLHSFNSYGSTIQLLLVGIAIGQLFSILFIVFDRAIQLYRDVVNQRVDQEVNESTLLNVRRYQPGETYI